MQRSTRVAARIARNLSRAAPKASSTAFRSVRTPVKSSIQLKQTSAFVKPLQARFFSSNDTEDVPVPSMGDSISEGTVVEWLKSPGDAVAADDVVVVLETDKVSVDVRSPYAGVMGEHLAGIDDNVTVGSPLFRVTKGEAPASSPAPSQPEPAAASSSPAPSGEEMTVEVPSMGDSISEGTIVSWMKGAGDAVAADDVVVVIETDKVSVDVRAPTSGTVVSMLAEVDQTVEVGKPLFTLQPGEAPSKPSTPEKPAAAKEEKKETKQPEKAAPSPPKQETPVQGAEPLLAFPSRQSHTEKMSRMRLRTAERLKESQNTSASLTTFQEVDMTNLMAMRKKYKDAFEDKHGVKLGFMSAFIKASSSALLEVPGVNAMIDEEHQEIVYRDFVDMSVAVSTPKGLVTPVLRNTESMGFADIEKAMGEMAVKARDNKLTLEELSGGNFTISNGGVFGSLMGTPIINVPQSGILGMHGTKMRPVVVNGEVVARPMMYLALTYDHRLIDGREAVTCLKSIADKVEDPERLLLDL